MAAPGRMDSLSDTAVVHLARLGSRDACDELVRRFRGAATMIARQIVRSEQTAEDVAQEALIAALTALPSLERPESFPHWLYAITRRKAQYHGMRDARSVPTEAEDLGRLCDERSHASDDQPLESLMLREKQEAVRTVLRNLSPEIQRVVYLFYYEQWTAAQIAAFLSLPLTTIKWRLYAGRKQVSERIRELLTEVSDVGEGSNERGDAAAPPAAKDSGIGGALGADRKLFGRAAEFDRSIQFDSASA